MNATATEPTTDATTQPGTDLLPFDVGELTALESRADQFRTAIAEAPPFKRAFLVAEAMRQLREMITPEMLASIQAGEGQALGFKTDKWKDGKNYPVEVIRDVTIEATLRGVSMVNNEVNIISGGFYMAKNGCKRRAKEWPGLSGLQVAFGVPEMKGGEALVSVRSVYWLDGKEHRFDRTEKNLEGGGTFDNRIAIRVNAGQGSDAILGKAERKFYAALLEHLSGEPVDSGDADDAIDVESSPAKPKRSTLFDDETDAPEDTGPDPSAQKELEEEYAAKLGQCENKSHVGPIAKQAGGDWRLAGETRKKVMEWCAARRKEL
jgi:hypothetical protein